MISRIPKRIIQTNKGLNLSPLGKAAVANVRLLNPDFEYLFFDDGQVEEFIDEALPQYRREFDAFVVPIQKYDFFREPKNNWQCLFPRQSTSLMA